MPSKRELPPLQLPVFAVGQRVKTGQFPHEAYVASCSCPEGAPQPVKNYAGHVVAPPRCSLCKAGYHLDIKRMPV